jgi:hypothetical protein
MQRFEEGSEGFVISEVGVVTVKPQAAGSMSGAQHLQEAAAEQSRQDTRTDRKKRFLASIHSIRQLMLPRLTRSYAPEDDASWPSPIYGARR